MKDDKVTEIHLLPIKNAATRVAALLSGEIDVVTDAPVQDLARIKNSPAHKVESTAQMRTIFLGMDQGADIGGSMARSLNDCDPDFQDDVKPIK